jgi:hypothetical protein
LNVQQIDRVLYQFDVQKLMQKKYQNTSAGNDQPPTLVAVKFFLHYTGNENFRQNLLASEYAPIFS